MAFCPDLILGIPLQMKLLYYFAGNLACFQVLNLHRSHLVVAELRLKILDCMRKQISSAQEVPRCQKKFAKLI